MSLHFHDSLFAHFSFAQGKSIRCLCFAQLRTSFRLADNVASLADVWRDQRRRGLQVRWSRSWYSPPYSLKSSPASLKIRLSPTMASRQAGPVRRDLNPAGHPHAVEAAKRESEAGNGGGPTPQERRCGTLTDVPASQLRRGGLPVEKMKAQEACPKDVSEFTTAEA